MICMYALRLSTTTVDEEEEDEEEEDSRTRSSSARWPEKEMQERRKRGLGSRDQVEKAVMKPVGSKGSSSSRSWWLWASREGRSEVTRQRGLSWARTWKRWWGCDCRSSITQPHDAHSVMERPELVVAHRPCADEQYGHFIARFRSVSC